ncbi:RRQRL motif-containing zinc-binding protein [Streptomyces sp. DT73]|uniref:RRQRL motif-containing zinc-binding protein n=1 Tax=Streptomyces sp. DT73 TaxID=3393420 RepID=UPI003CEF67A2
MDGQGATYADLVDIDIHASRDGRDQFPEFDWRNAPKHLVTRRQLRAAGLSPGGHGPVAQLRCRRCTTRPNTGCTHLAWLYDTTLAKPKRTPTLAQEWALDRAMAARQTCAACGRRYHFVLSTKFDRCLECHDGTPADPATYIAPPAAHRLAA